MSDRDLRAYWNQIGLPASERKGAANFAGNHLDINVDARGEIVKPDIEGAFGFDRVWDTNKNFCDLAMDAPKLQARAKRIGIQTPAMDNAFSHLSGTVRNAFCTLSCLQRSHVITVDPAQLNVLPAWDAIEDTLDYAAHVKLPFDSIFLDCELPTRETAYVESPIGDRYQLFGGCVEITEECLIILPFGRGKTKAGGNLVQGDEFEKQHNDIESDHLSLGAVVFNMAKDPEAPRADLFDNSEPVTIHDGEMLNYKYRQWEFDLRWMSQLIEQHGHDNDEPLDFGSLPAEEFKGPPSACRIVVIPPLWNEATAGSLIGTAAVLFIGAAQLLQALYFLDTPNIELVEKPVSRQVRRSAERRNATIAKTIFVKHNQHRSPAKDGDVERINYSHRFEVRGHWKYYPEGTQMTDARPDLLRYVPNRGMCRKIWCPPFVKGNPEKPLVLKTRRLREETNNDTGAGKTE